MRSEVIARKPWASKVWNAPRAASEMLSFVFARIKDHNQKKDIWTLQIAPDACLGFWIIKMVAKWNEFIHPKIFLQKVYKHT